MMARIRASRPANCTRRRAPDADPHRSAVAAATTPAALRYPSQHFPSFRRGSRSGSLNNDIADRAPFAIALPENTRAARPRRSPFDLALALLAALSLSLFVVRSVFGYLETGRAVVLFLLVGETLSVLLVSFARPPRVRSLHPLDTVTTIVATYYFLLFNTQDGGRALLPDPFPELLMMIGIAFQVSAKWTLGRSFGLLPANRGIVSSGPYRLVRHPIYLSYLLGHIGFLLGFMTLHNLLVILSLYALQIARMLMEERVLFEDPAYVAYARKVRWRFIPFLF